MRRLPTPILILIVLVGAVVLFSLFGKENVSLVSNETPAEQKDGVAVLILGQVGVGQGGQWHLAPGLVDTIVLAQYKPETGVANLISLPRDLYGDFGEKRIKLNRVFLEEELGGLLDTVPEITGIETDKYLVLDLDAVSKVVDGLGGIEIELPSAVTDPVSGFTLPAGPQRLDGESTVWLIRNRFAPEGDFFRERNQHLVVSAIFDKFKNLSLVRKTAFAFSILPEIVESQANFSVGELISEMKGVGEVEFNSVTLGFDTKLLESNYIPTADGNSYVLTPTAGINEYTQIREFIEERVR